MLKKILILIVVLIAVLLCYAATKPDTFRVQRTTSINAPPEKIFAIIDDFHNWGSWSPWEKLDPAMKRTYSGAASGQGAVYAWEGNDKVGAGRMEITDSAPPSKVTIKLDFIKPFEAHDIAELTLEPPAAADTSSPVTTVTWAMHGPNPFISKVMQVFMNVDTMVGKDFEDGLANLKNVAEK